MRVMFACSYLARTVKEDGEKINWRDEDYASKKFIDAFKPDRKVNGYAWIPVNGQNKKLREENRADAVKWCGEMGAPRLASAVDGTKGIVIVPVPCSTAVDCGPSNPGPRALADSIAAEWNKALGTDSKKPRI